MPNKTRTSKNKSKQTKLKWWYILPVIAIVAVAGYAIVRFSEAGSAYTGIRTTTAGRANAPEFSGCNVGWVNGVWKFDVIAVSKAFRARVTSITVEVVNSSGKVVDRAFQPNWLPGRRVTGVQLKATSDQDRVRIFYVDNGKTYKFASGINYLNFTACQNGVLPFGVKDYRNYFRSNGKNPPYYGPNATYP